MVEGRSSSNGKIYPTMKTSGNLLRKYEMSFLSLTLRTRSILKGGGGIDRNTNKWRKVYSKRGRSKAVS